LDMMLRTCTVQANLDYSSEKDAIKKLQVALRLQPVVTAIFANSPFVEGKMSGERSHRALVWLYVDPNRTGLLDFAWKENAIGYRDYVEWALDVPMFFIKRKDQIIKNTGQSFREFMKNGFQGTFATLEDWKTHLNTLFPEVRLKRTLELRGSDSVGLRLAPALAALWKGLLYDPDALQRAESLASRLSLDEVKRARPEIARHALRAILHNREVAEWAWEIVEIADRGLSALGKNSSKERRFLEPFRRLIERAKSPADLLLELLDSNRPLLSHVLEYAAFDDKKFYEQILG
ncbi:MAG: glutamate-cysteine ligase family protein, partial [Sandaracinaceae bacterium]|nr:glutamate-cysteine ligase family protein [Sandaracinaceae bacterium]